MAVAELCGRLTGTAVVRQAIVVCGSAAVVWALFLREFGPADLSVFVGAGRAVANGFSPYVDASSPGVWSGHAFVYPYLVAWCFIPFAALSMAASGVLYYLASVAALVSTVRMLGGPRVGALPVVLALTAEPVVRALQLGTLNVWLLFGLAVAWRHRRRTARVVAALAAVIVAKLFLFPILAWLVLTRRVRAAVWTALASVAAVVVGCGMADLSVGSFVHMLSVLSDHEAPQSSSITALLHRLDAGSVVATGGALLLAALIVAGGWAQARRAGDERYLFSACVLASIAASPIVWSHYFALILVIPLIFRWRRRSQLIAWTVTWLVLAPGGAPILRVLHPFPGAGWLWGGIVVGAALAWRYRAAAHARVCGQRGIPVDPRSTAKVAG